MNAKIIISDLFRSALRGTASGEGCSLYLRTESDYFWGNALLLEMI